MGIKITVWHGTNTRIPNFAGNRGAYFAEQYDDAADYGKNVFRVKLELNNPLVSPYYPLSQKARADIDYILQPVNEEGYDAKNAVGGGYIFYPALANMEVIRRMKEMGYDSAFVYEPIASDKRSILVIDPKCIKSWGAKPVRATLKSALLRDEPMLFLLRHGTTEANIEDEFRGWEDFELDEQGVNEAHEAAEWFLAHGVKPKHIISSPLSRALATAKIIGAALGVEVEIDEGFMPLHVGEYTGRGKDKMWDEFVYYLDHPDEVIPEGESTDEFADRDCRALDLRLDQAEKDGPSIVVCHTSNVVVADCYLRTDDVGMDCRPEEKDIVAPGGIVAIYPGRVLKPVFKDVKEKEKNTDPEKAEHEEYDVKETV